MQLRRRHCNQGNMTATARAETQPGNNKTQKKRASLKIKKHQNCLPENHTHKNTKTNRGANRKSTPERRASQAKKHLPKARSIRSNHTDTQEKKAKGKTRTANNKTQEKRASLKIKKHKNCLPENHTQKNTTRKSKQKKRTPGRTKPRNIYPRPGV